LGSQKLVYEIVGCLSP